MLAYFRFEVLFDEARNILVTGIDNASTKKTDDYMECPVLLSIQFKDLGKVLSFLGLLNLAVVFLGNVLLKLYEILPKKFLADYHVMTPLR
jgi:hypothetical protein